MGWKTIPKKKHPTTSPSQDVNDTSDGNTSDATMDFCQLRYVDTVNVSETSRWVKSWEVSWENFLLETWKNIGFCEEDMIFGGKNTHN